MHCTVDSRRGTDVPAHVLRQPTEDELIEAQRREIKQQKFGTLPRNDLRRIWLPGRRDYPADTMIMRSIAFAGSGAKKGRVFLRG